MLYFSLLRTTIFLLLWSYNVSVGIKNVRLILPSMVQAGSSATLFCLYDLEGASLYSVQWYRGQFEFFRYNPHEIPPSKVFQIPGLIVDMLKSTEHQVSLKNISLYLSGEFSCEITTDTPHFSTSCVSGNLTVVGLKLFLEKPKKTFQIGEIVTANCTLIPLLPSIKLKFFWNTTPIPDKFLNYKKSNSVHLKLNTSLFTEKTNTETLVRLTCSAMLDEFYHVTSKSVLLHQQLSPLAEESGVEKLKPENIKVTILYIIIVILLTTN